MMRALAILGVLVLLVGGYYAIWRYGMAEDVARVEASIAHHNLEFRKHNRWVTLKSDGASPAGFPFDSHVRIARPTLTFVQGDETYGVSLPYAKLHRRDAASGTYEVTYPETIEALYAKSGLAPEEYSVTPAQPLRVLLRTQGDSRQCSGLPGMPRCAGVGAADPLISYAVELPSSITIRIGLNGAEKDARFTLIPLSMPVYMAVPNEADRPLELFVNILREAMVFQK